MSLTKNKKHFDTCINQIVDDYRQTYGRSPTRNEIYLAYKAAMDQRMFSDDKDHVYKKTINSIASRSSNLRGKKGITNPAVPA